VERGIPVITSIKKLGTLSLCPHYTTDENKIKLANQIIDLIEQAQGK